MKTKINMRVLEVSYLSIPGQYLNQIQLHPGLAAFTIVNLLPSPLSCNITIFKKLSIFYSNSQTIREFHVYGKLDFSDSSKIGPPTMSKIYYKKAKNGMHRERKVQGQGCYQCCPDISKIPDMNLDSTWICMQSYPEFVLFHIFILIHIQHKTIMQ